MSFLLDTNACIQYLNGTSESVRIQLDHFLPEQLYLCSVVKAKLLYGFLKGKRRPETQARLYEFLSAFPSLSFDDKSAERYGMLRFQLESEGRPIGSNDMMIAAIALANGLILVTPTTCGSSREFRA